METPTAGSPVFDIKGILHGKEDLSPLTAAVLGGVMGNGSWWQGPAEEWDIGLHLSCASTPHREEWFDLRLSLSQWLRLPPFSLASFEGTWENSSVFGNWLHLPAYDECPYGQLALRLWQLLRIVTFESQKIPWMLEFGCFTEEVNLLFETAPWRLLLISGWASIIFALLSTLQNQYCEVVPHMCKHERDDSPTLPVHLRQDTRGQIDWHIQLVGLLDGKKTGKPVCSYFRAMVEAAAVGEYLPPAAEVMKHHAGIGQTLVEVFNAAEEALRACVQEDKRLVLLMRSYRRVWHLLASLAHTGGHEPAMWRPAPGGKHALVDALKPGLDREALPVQMCGQPTCEIRHVGFRSHELGSPVGYLTARVLGASVVRPTGGMQQHAPELELLIFIEPDPVLSVMHENCDTFFGASFFRLGCNFYQNGKAVGSVTTAASAASYAFGRPRPPNLYICSIPLEVDLSSRFRLELTGVSLDKPIRINFCPSLDDNTDSGSSMSGPQTDSGKKSVLICSRPLFDVQAMESSQHMVSDWLHYHHHLGVKEFTVYDADGSVNSTLAQDILAKYNVTVFSEGNGTEQSKCFRPLQRESYIEQSTPWSYQWARQMGCPELVYNHCLHRARGRAKWLLLLRAPDKYLVGTTREDSLSQLLQRADAAHAGGAALVSLIGKNFGEVHKDSPGVKADAPLVLQHLWHAPSALIVWVTMMDPLRTLAATNHIAYARPGFVQTDELLHPETEVWINHYLDWGSVRRRAGADRLERYGGAKALFNTTDTHVLWALPRLFERRVTE